MATEKIVHTLTVQVRPFLESTTPELVMRVSTPDGKTYTARELFPTNDFESVFDRVAGRALNRLKIELKVMGGI